MNNSQCDADTFFHSDAGQYCLEWELEQHDHCLANVFGYYAVQIGLPSIDYLRKNRILKRYSLGRHAPANVIADPQEIPLESDSMDLVVLPHQLEFSSNPHQILREVERILLPEGKVVIAGFNPYSLWGGYQKWGRKKNAQLLFPWGGKYIPLSRLKDWLKLLNFEIKGGWFGCYRPPNLRSSFGDRLAFVEKAGNRWWPTFGAVYLICAQKKVLGMRLMERPWKELSSYSAKPATILPSQSKKDHDC